MISRKLVSSVSNPETAQRILISATRFCSSFAAFSSSSSLTTQFADDDNLIRLNHKDWLAPNEVLKIFDNVKDPRLLILAYEKYSNRKDYKPTESLYTLLINKLAQIKRFDEIEDVVKRIKLRRHCRLSEEFFYNVIRVYGNLAGRINRAIETLFDMPKFGCWPSSKTFNLVLNQLVSAKLFDVVHDIFINAAKLGVEIDACCLNILIKGLCESGNLEAAFQVLDEFPKQNSKPNVMTFSPMMRAFCSKGKLEEAFGLLERMEKEGIEPDTITYNILISGLRKKGRIEDGIELLKRMKLEGCEPNQGSYQEVLYGLLDEKRFLDAKGMMSRMILWSMSPSFVSYKKLIQGLCDEKLVDEVEWVLKQMVKQGFVPKMGMWRQVLRCGFSGNRAYDFGTFDRILNNLSE